MLSEPNREFRISEQKKQGTESSTRSKLKFYPQRCLQKAHCVNQTSPGRKQRQQKRFLSLCIPPHLCSGFPGGSVVRSPPADAGDTQGTVQSLGQEDPLEEELADPLQYSSVESPRDRGAQRATTQGVTNTQM